MRRPGVPRPVTIVDFEHRSRPHAVPAGFFGAPVLRGCGCMGLEIPFRRWVVKMKRASVSGVAEEAEHNGLAAAKACLQACGAWKPQGHGTTRPPRRKESEPMGAIVFRLSSLKRFRKSPGRRLGSWKVARICRIFLPEGRGFSKCDM